MVACGAMRPKPSSLSSSVTTRGHAMSSLVKVTVRDEFSEVGRGLVWGWGSHSPTDGAEQRDGVAVRGDQRHLQHAAHLARVRVRVRVRGRVRVGVGVRVGVRVRVGVGVRVGVRAKVGVRVRAKVRAS